VAKKLKPRAGWHGGQKYLVLIPYGTTPTRFLFHLIFFKSLPPDSFISFSSHGELISYGTKAVGSSMASRHQGSGLLHHTAPPSVGNSTAPRHQGSRLLQARSPPCTTAMWLNSGTAPQAAWARRRCNFSRLRGGTTPQAVRAPPCSSSVCSSKVVVVWVWAPPRQWRCGPMMAGLDLGPTGQDLGSGGFFFWCQLT
jgi:hypothetical protein